MTEDYYVSKQALLLSLFDKLMVRVARSLRRDYGDEFTDEVVPEMRERFEEIIPEIPYLGGMKNVFTEIIILNGMLVAIHQVLRKHGCDVEATIRLYCEISSGMFEALPQSLLNAGGRLMLSKPAKRLFERQADRSQARRYPEDWVYTYVEGDGQTYDHGLKFTECAVIKFYEVQGVQELTPYCDFFDVIMGRAMNMGCVCSPHLGSGGEVCFFQYKCGRETPVPERLKRFIHE